MLPRDLAFVGCRLLAVYVFLTVLQAQISNIHFYLLHLKNVEETGIEQHSDFEFFFMSALLNLGFCAALWFGAGWLSGKVAAGAPHTQGEQPAAWSLQTALSVVVIASGLWLLILLGPSLTYVLQQLFRSGRADFISVAYVVVAVVLGLVCVLSPRAIAGVISRARDL